jgi:hypothetical protein
LGEGRRGDRYALIAMLVDAGLLDESAREHVDAATLIAALHTFIRRTPSALVGLSLDDLARESEPVNIPGIWQDRYPSWSRRTSLVAATSWKTESTAICVRFEIPTRLQMRYGAWPSCRGRSGLRWVKRPGERFRRSLARIS